MNLKNLEKRVAKAQQKLQALELKALNAERVAKAAKTKAQQLKLEHREAKQIAKAAKWLATQLAEEAQEQCRVLEKTERRLAKAVKKTCQLKASAPAEVAPPSGHRLAQFKTALAKRSPARPTVVPMSTRRSAGNGHPAQTKPHTPENASSA
jgi:hypothetical protein